MTDCKQIIIDDSPLTLRYQAYLEQCAKNANSEILKYHERGIRTVNFPIMIDGVIDKMVAEISLGFADGVRSLYVQWFFEYTQVKADSPFTVTDFDAVNTARAKIEHIETIRVYLLTTTVFL